MRALRTFTVRVPLPEPLSPLRSLATNLRWSWDDRTKELFRWVDAEAFDETGGDPVAVLDRTTPARLAALAADPTFLTFLGEVHDELRRDLEGARWFQGRAATGLGDGRAGGGVVAYFSPEFGLAEALPQYSGGLGVLAGDHLKAAAGLGVPLVGVGLLYREGYFRQSLRGDGWQEERYPVLDPHSLPLAGPTGATVEVEVAGQVALARVWRADVGRIRLYLLDTSVEENPPELAALTDRLYGGGPEHRIAQEILLGMGGVRALRAVGEAPVVFHTNEGHAGFQGLERIRELVTTAGLGFDEALEAVRAATVFTTHTPVAAGIDRFPPELVRRHFHVWAEACGIPVERLLALGRFPGEDDGAAFNMAVMGLRLAGAANGVSQLHGRVSRAMFARLWPDLEADDVPIGSVTNGVHAPTWVSPEMADLFGRSVLPAWWEAGPEEWARAAAIPDEQLWRAHEQGRERLVALVRARVERRRTGAGNGLRIEDLLDPRVLTIGFARRFAPYKRATLLARDPERLRALLLSAERPVQLVFAGKAHPADDAGKELIRSVVELAHDPLLQHRIAFVEDYDIAVARTFYQGVDVWLNTPRRPMEACGTSGMKAALNGALNCSVLDGWWDECYDGTNGWAIPSDEEEPDEHARDAREAAALFSILEREVVPLFYDRLGGPVPRRWVRRVKASLTTLAPTVLASRMVREYTTGLYEPAARRHQRLAGTSGRYRPAVELAAWKQRVSEAWGELRIVSVRSDEDGQGRSVEAEVDLGRLEPADVRVSLLYGPVGPGEELDAPAATDMAPVEGATLPRQRYRAAIECDRPGRYGFTVRATPAHADLAHPLELGLVRWP
jgi:starch phosphorylase